MAVWVVAGALCTCTSSLATLVLPPLGVIFTAVVVVSVAAACVLRAGAGAGVFARAADSADLAAAAAFCRASSARREASAARFSASATRACCALPRDSPMRSILASRSAIFSLSSAILTLFSWRMDSSEERMPAMVSLTSVWNWAFWAIFSSILERMRCVSSSTWPSLLTELAWRLSIWPTSSARKASTFWLTTLT